MFHPYQCIAAVRPSLTKPDRAGFLIAACGPELLSTCLTNGKIVSRWAAGEGAPEAAADDEEGEEKRPTKRHRRSPGSGAAPNVIKLTISPDQLHVVAVTDDKVVRVFELEPDGTLIELSQRSMPKRPCAVEVMPDNSTILCGDKFGDVYSLPLLQELRGEVADAVPNTHVTPPEKPFKPSANNLTVHTQRNRKALEAQLRQKSFTSRREPLNFEHKLLLGHVSMLTDIAIATQDVDGKRQSHIITADRDEHIRVSRGPPQAHIIEGYCLGHTEFVSKICVIPGTTLLVSGGGDSWIGIWDWSQSTLKAKLDLRMPVHDLLGRLPGNHQHRNITVSGIWFVSGLSFEQSVAAVAVACEKVPALFILPTALLLRSSLAFTTLQLSRPPLDVTSVRDRLIVSLDGRLQHEKGLECYRFETTDSNPGDLQVKPDDELGETLNGMNILKAFNATEKALDELLYGMANLRKRRGQDEAETVDSTNTGVDD